MTIMSRIPFPTLSNDLAADLTERDIVQRLLRTLESTDIPKATFAAGQLWLITTLLLRPARGIGSARQRLVVPLLKVAEKYDVTKQLEFICNALAVHFKQTWRENDEVSGPYKPGGVYFSRLLECIMHARDVAFSDPLRHRVDGILQHISDQLRDF